MTTEATNNNNTAKPSKALLLSIANVIFFGILGSICCYFFPLSVISLESYYFRYKRTALVTAIYFLFFYIAIFYQSMISLLVWNEKKDQQHVQKENNKTTKPPTLWDIKYGPISYTDRRIVACNRIVGNTIEQMPAFIVGIWLLAVLSGDDNYAGACGWCYVIFRSVLYPILYVSNPTLILIATIPNYILILYIWIIIVKTII